MKTIINIYLIGILSTLVGCATTTRLPPEIIEKPVIVEVEIPIVQPCVTEEVPLPELLIGSLTDSDINEPGKVVQFYVADVTLLKGVILRQKSLLDACKIEEPSTDDTPIPNGNPPPAPAKPTTEKKKFDPLLLQDK